MSSANFSGRSFSFSMSPPSPPSGAYASGTRSAFRPAALGSRSPFDFTVVSAPVSCVTD